MKTGRVRKKEGEPPPEKKEEAQPQPAKKTAKPALKPRPSTATTAQKSSPPWLILGGLAAVLICLVAFFAFLLGNNRADDWVKVSRANGEWTTIVTVLGPQVTVEERWQADCQQDPQGTVQAGTCVLKDTDEYQDTVVDEYEEYAYHIYYEETYAQVYEASGTEFVETRLQNDDWWQEDLHYVLEEELDRESCVYTSYTVWVDDRQDSTQEVEVYLSECEVWDHVTVYERIYEQAAWCQCDVTNLVQIGVQREEGTGGDVRWPQPRVPAGGRTERAFEGEVTFLGDDWGYTVTTEDVAQYQDYLSQEYYIGLKDGKPIKVRRRPEE
jgi:hypothetical protein